MPIQGEHEYILERHAWYSEKQARKIGLDICETKNGTKVLVSHMNTNKKNKPHFDDAKYLGLITQCLSDTIALE